MPKKIEAPEGQGYCGRCEQFISKDLFHKDLKRPTGVARYCKKCATEYNRKRLGHNIKVVRNLPAGISYCCRCKTEKPSIEFTTSTRKTDGRHSWCKACINAYTYQERGTEDRISTNFGANHHNYKSADEILSTEEQRAYVAGLFDAEGTIQIVRGRMAAVLMSIAGNNECLLLAAQNVIGGKVYWNERTKTKRDGTSEDIAEGRLSLNSAAERIRACNTLMPYLILKKKRCEIALKAMSVHPRDRSPLRDEICLENRKQSGEFLEKNPEKRQLGLADVTRLTEIQFSYLAGMIDGDGWIGYANSSLGFGCAGIAIALSSAKPDFIEKLHAIYGGKMSNSVIHNEKSDSIASGLALKVDDEAWGLFLRRLAKYLVLKKNHALILADYADGKSKLSQTEMVDAMTNMTREARLEKFSHRRDQNSMSPDEARVYSLGWFVEGGEGRKVKIESAPDAPDASDLGIKMYSLSEYAKKEEGITC